jgi:hypothetical protein
VGEQQVLAEAPGAAFGHRVEGHAGELLVDRQLFGRQGERHQGRLGRHDGEAELLGDLVAQRRGADLGDRQPAGGHHQACAGERPWLVSRMKRLSGASVDASSLQGMAQLTWPSSHSARSMSMMSWAESSQNSWPCSRSCQAMPWRSPAR